MLVRGSGLSSGLGEEELQSVVLGAGDADLESVVGRCVDPFGEPPGGPFLHDLYEARAGEDANVVASLAVRDAQCICEGLGRPRFVLEEVEDLCPQWMGQGLELGGFGEDEGSGGSGHVANITENRCIWETADEARSMQCRCIDFGGRPEGGVRGPNR